MTIEVVMKSSLPSPSQTSSVSTTSVSPLAQTRHWVQHLNGEARTRILLLYAVTMLLVFGASIPIFRYFLFAEVNNQVRKDLEEEVEKFEIAYDRWDAETDDSIELL